MDWIFEPQAWVALVTLTAVEVVLGIDNIVFLSILVGRLPAGQQASARTLGLAGAMVSRILLLLGLSWIMRLTAPLFSVLGTEISGRDLILIAGGLFLLAKATKEIHHQLEEAHAPPEAKGRGSYWSIVAQVTVIDIVFSLDSVITAIGLASQVQVMVAAILLAIVVMMVFAGAVNRFIEKHPTIRMLALSFLLLIGMALVAEGLEIHIPKTSIYFAMAFSLGVEILNMRAAARKHRGRA